MVNINAPKTTEATTEINGRISTINSQIEEAERMVKYHTGLADQQAAASTQLQRLRTSYLALLDDAGARHEEPLHTRRNGVGGTP